MVYSISDSFAKVLSEKLFVVEGKLVPNVVETEVIDENDENWAFHFLVVVAFSQLVG